MYARNYFLDSSFKLSLEELKDAYGVYVNYTHTYTYEHNYTYLLCMNIPTTADYIIFLIPFQFGEASAEVGGVNTSMVHMQKTL